MPHDNRHREQTTAERLRQYGIQTYECRAPKCKRQMFQVVNVVSKQGGPVDPRPTVYVVLAPPTMTDPPRAMTGRQFIEELAEVRMKDGTVLPASEIVGLFVSHFQTCAEPNKF